jgi:hypothetical protein
LALSLKAYKRKLDRPMLSWAPVINVSTYILKLPYVIGDNICESDAHLAQAPMELTDMGVDPETKQASFMLMSFFYRKVATLGIT